MEITQDDAQRALQDIAAVSDRTKRALSLGPAPEILMLWGLVWMCCYAGNQFASQLSGPIWLVGVAAGTIGSCALGYRSSKSVTKTDGTKDPNIGKIGLAWCALFGYAVLWVFILDPNGGERSGELASMQTSAFIATIPMFGYVVGGLWLGRFYVWLGLIVTAITMVGLLGFPQFFWIWMAFFGGGALFATGLYMRKVWANA